MGILPEQEEAAAVADAERVCHAEQLLIWADDIIGRLSIGGYFRDGISYDEGLELRRQVMDEIKSIVESAFTHPELQHQPLSD